MGFSFTSSTKAVLEQVVREPRFRTLTTIPLFAPMEIGLIVAAFGLFGTSSYLYLGGDLPWFVMTALNSLAIYASFTPLHDSTHRTLSSNRRFNDVMGTISCLLLLPGITTRIYRYLHLEHHRYAGDVGKDPDEPFVSARAWRIPLILAGLDVLWTRWYISRWSTRPLGERVEFVASITFYVLFHVGWLLSPYALEFLLVWVVPQRLGLFYVSWFFARIQHPKGVSWEQTPFQATVRVVTSRLAELLLLGQSNHHMHHLAPSVPWYRYQRAWDLGKSRLLKEQIPTRTVFAESRDLVLPEAEDTRWLDARVARVAEVGKGIRSYELIPRDNQAWPRFTAGSHIDVRVENDAVRQYSLCNSPSEKNRYVIAVKHEAQGQGGSAFIHARVTQGDTLRIGTPRNNFPVREHGSDFLLIAGGIGITPLLSMAHQLAESGRRFKLHVCARDRSAVAFHDELTDLPFSENLETHIDGGESGQRFDAAEAIGRYVPGRVMYLCGPTGFMAATMQTAQTLGWPADTMFSETFVPPSAASGSNLAFEVELARSGTVLQVGANESLLDVLNDNDCAVICSCTQGICGSCMTPVLGGLPEHRDAIMTDAELAQNNQMTVCVSREKTSRLVLDL